MLYQEFILPIQINTLTSSSGADEDISSDDRVSSLLGGMVTFSLLRWGELVMLWGGVTMVSVLLWGGEVVLSLLLQGNVVQLSSTSSSGVTIPSLQRDDSLVVNGNVCSLLSL